MAFSDRAARLHWIALLAAGGFVISAGSLSGCAHAGAARAEPPRPTGGAERTVQPPPAALDPSEEITPRELASIPEPVPVAPAARSSGSAPPATAATRAPEAQGKPTEPRSEGAEASNRASPGPGPSAPAVPNPKGSPEPGGPWIWRVQILATPDLALAKRVAGEAAERLGTTSRVDSEPPMHKVRLGGFGSEADAQILKSRAVEMGYPGAFRVKIRILPTDG